MERERRIPKSGLLIALYLLHDLYPIVGAYMPSAVYLTLFALTAIMELSFLLGVNTRINYLNHFEMLLIYLPFFLQTVIYSFDGNYNRVPTYLYGFFQSVLNTVIAMDYLENGDLFKNKKLLTFVIIAYMITGLTTGLVAINNPNVARTITANASSELYYSFRRMNVGEFSFVYQFVLLTPLAIYVIKEKRIPTIFGIAILAFMAFVILESQFTTALMMFALCVLLLFVGKITSKKIVFLVLVAVFLFLFAKYVLADFFAFLSENVSNENYVARFKYISYLLDGRQISDSMITEAGNRYELYMKSWHYFLEHPIFGGWNKAEIGGHSFVFDTLAKYGILGIIVVISVFKTMYKLFIKPFQRLKIYPYFIFGFILSIAVAIVNPKYYPFVFCFIYPLFGTLAEESEYLNTMGDRL